MKKGRKILISLLILAGMVLFHYESIRFLYLSPALGRLPEIPFLFPKNGWTLFYKFENFWVNLEVFGSPKGKNPEWIDPHRIFRTRFWGFDTVPHNSLMNIAIYGTQPEFCAFLKKKFPAYENFLLVQSGYRQLVPRRSEKEVFSYFQC